MRRLCLIALGLSLLTGCVPGDNAALFPDLKGRWAPEKAVRARLSLASNNSSVPIVAPTLQELCKTEYITFNKFPDNSEFAGVVMLTRKDRRDAVFMARTVKREGNRIVLTGQEPNHPLAGKGRTRLELIVRNGEVAFADIFDERGRSVRHDQVKIINDAVRAQRAGLNTVGDLFSALLDLKSCAT